MPLSNAGDVRIFFRRQVLPDHLDNATADGGAHARMRRVGRGNRGSARQRKTQGLVIAIIVAAVPITMHVPKERAMPPQAARPVGLADAPARFSSQYFQASDPDPSSWPRQLPRSCGPAGT